MKLAAFATQSTVLATFIVVGSVQFALAATIGGGTVDDFEALTFNPSVSFNFIREIQTSSPSYQITFVGGRANATDFDLLGLNPASVAQDVGDYFNDNTNFDFEPDVFESRLPTGVVTSDNRLVNEIGFFSSSSPGAILSGDSDVGYSVVPLDGRSVDSYARFETINTPPDVPEPSTILGSVLVLGIGVRVRLSKNKKRNITESKLSRANLDGADGGH